MSTSVDQMIGPYRLEALIGRGSMADVYQARHMASGERVAIKRIHPHLIDTPELFKRFEREAEAMKAMQHPHIARVYEFVAQAGDAYIVMEYLTGGTLELRLAKHALRHQAISLDQAAEWMDAICDAVEFAHRQGLVHRDLKPANILFRENGQLVLADFGLAYWVDHPRLSGTGAVTGTPAYLSPEQARGLPGDRRSDVYSLGVILYEILAGQTPFTGNTLGVAVKHISELPPSPRVLGRYLPPGVEAVVMRALAKDPVERYQSAQALAGALRTAVERAAARGASAPAPAPASPAPTSGVAAPGVEPGHRPDEQEEAAPAGSAWRRPWLAGLVTVLMLAALFGGAWLGITQLHGPQPVAARSAPRFAVGSPVRVVVPDQASVSVLRGCPTGFWMGVLGVASDGETGRVLERQTCEGEWWYHVALPGAGDATWDGTGWLSDAYLEVR